MDYRLSAIIWYFLCNGYISSQHVSKIKNGLASPDFEKSLCNEGSKIHCPKDYVVIIIDAEFDYRLIHDVTCDSDSSECTEQSENLEEFENSCTGNQICRLEPRAKTLYKCQNKTANYLNVLYKCVPTRYANPPRLQKSIEICKAGNDDKIIVNTSLLLKNSRTQRTQKCSKLLVPQHGKSLSIYIINSTLENNDYLKISDCQESKNLTRVSYRSSLILSNSDSISIDYFSNNLNDTNVLLYVEASNSSETCNKICKKYKISIQPSRLDFMSGKQRVIIKPNSEVDFVCLEDHILIVINEYLVNIGDEGNRYKQCRQNFDLASKKCNGNPNCSIHICNQSIPHCREKKLDQLEIELNSIPALNPNLKRYSCYDSNVHVNNIQNGLIVSSDYSRQPINCTITLKPRSGYGYNIFIIYYESYNQNLGDCLSNFVSVNGEKLCDDHDKPRFFTATDYNAAFTVNSKHQSDDGHKPSFKFYFEEYLLQEIGFTKKINMSTSTQESKLSKFFNSAILVIALIYYII